MRKHAVLLALLTLSILAVATSPAGAKKGYSVFVTTTPTIVNECLIAPDQYHAAVQFKAKVSRKKGYSLPSRITVHFKVTDSDTSQVLLDQNLTLKPTLYLKVSKVISFVAAHKYTLAYSSTFKAQGSKKKIKASHSQPYPIPDAATLATLGLPACV